jgi:hypothetical protein
MASTKNWQIPFIRISAKNKAADLILLPCMYGDV